MHNDEGNAICYPTLIMKEPEDDETRSYTFVPACNKYPPKMCDSCKCVFEKEGVDYRFKEYRKEPRRVIDVKTPDGKVIVLELYPRRVVCKHCGYSFWEQFECCGPGDKITFNLAKNLAVRAVKAPFKPLAEEYGISITTVRNAFYQFCEEHARELIYAMPKNLGIDETKLAGEMRLILTDPNHRKVLDIYDSNTPDCFRHYFAERAKNYADLGNIKNIVIDMNAGYMSLIKEIFDSSVKIVIDRYHVVGLFNRNIKKYRVEIQAAETDNTWRRRLYGAKDLLTTNWETIRATSVKFRDGDKKTLEKYSSDPQLRLERIFERYPQLEAVYRLKESLRMIYRFTNRQDAGEHFMRWLETVKAAEPSLNTKLFTTAAKTYERHIEYILNWFGAKITNGFTEAMNGSFKDVVQSGHGYGYEVLRLKCLFRGKVHKYNPSIIDFRTAKRVPNTSFRMFTVEDLDIMPDGLTEAFIHPVSYQLSDSNVDFDPNDPNWL